MKGMLLKSWKNIAPLLAYYLAFVLIFFVVSILSKSNLYFCGVSVMLAFAVPTSAMSIDERDGWDKFAVASGTGRGELAVSRYIFSLLAMLPLWALAAGLSVILPERARQFASMLLFCGVSLFVPSLMLPLMHRFGVEKTRILLLVVVALLFGAGVAFGGFFLQGEMQFSIPLFSIPTIVVALGTVCLAFSCIICIRICRCKDF